MRALARGAASIIVTKGYVANSTATPTFLYNTYYNDLFADLAHDGVIFKTADVLSLQQTIFANPGAYGFTSISNVDGPNGTALIIPILAQFLILGRFMAPQRCYAHLMPLRRLFGLTTSTLPRLPGNRRKFSL